MSNLTARGAHVDIDVLPVIADAMEAVQDRALAIEDRAALYGVLHQVQLRINRALRAAKDDLIVYLESTGLRELGPLSTKATAIDVKWPANDEANWADATVQEAMELYAKVAPEYFRHGRRLSLAVREVRKVA